MLSGFVLLMVLVLSGCATSSPPATASRPPAGAPSPAPVAPSKPADPLDQRLVEVVAAFDIGHHDRARQDLESILADLDRTRPTDLRVAAILNLLSAMSAADYGGPRDGGAERLDRSLVVAEGALGPRDPDFIETLRVMAEHYAAKGLRDQSVAVANRRLDLLGETLGPQHPKVVAGRLVQRSEAVLARQGGELAEAEALLRQALAVQEGAFGEQHPDVADTLEGLAWFARIAQRIDDAESLARRGLAIRRIAHGHAHPSVVWGLALLVALLAMQDKALEPALLAESVGHRERVLGRPPVPRTWPLYPYSVEALERGLRAVWSVKGMAVPAGVFIEKSHGEALLNLFVATLATNLGADHPAVALNLRHLAAFYRHKGRAEEAQRLDIQAAAIDRRNRR